MRIDGHGHACCQYLTVGRINAELDRHQFDKVVLFPAEPGKDKIDVIPDLKRKNILYFSNIIGAFLTRFMKLSEKIDMGNTYISDLKKQLPNRIIQFYQVTPDYVHKLEADYERMRFSGVKVHQSVKYFSIRSPFFQTVLDFVEKNHLPLVIHLCGKKDALDLIETLKRRTVTIIVAHLLFYKLFQKDWEQLQSKVYFDLANYYFVSPKAALEAVAAFGCERLIFGSDNPFGVNSIEKTIHLIESLPVDQNGRAKIMGGNYQAILSL